MLNLGSTTTSKQSGAEGTIRLSAQEPLQSLQISGLDIADMGDLQEAEDSANAELRNVGVGAVILYLCE